MAQHVNKGRFRPAIAAVYVLAVSLPGTILAQALPDPTRPPALLAEPDRDAAKPVSGPELQSVLIAPSRRIATINGQALRVGERFGDARVAKISENEVVLRNGREVQVLKLFPQVEKRKEQGTHATKAKDGTK